MKTRDIITELGDAPYRYEYNPEWSDTVSTYFEADTPSGTLVVEFASISGVIEISFVVNGRLKITGKGDQFKVFSTVMDIISRELPGIIAKAGPVRMIKFAAGTNEPSRISLYTRGAAKITKILGSGWQHQVSSPREGVVSFRWYLPTHDRTVNTLDNQQIK
jgi:hypothetical protein